MPKTYGWKLRVHRFFVNYVTWLRDSLPPWSCWNNPQIAVHLILEKQIQMILKRLIFWMFVMQHKCTKDSPPMHKRMHHRCTMDAPWMYNGCTKDAHWTHNECCLNTLRMHHGFIHMYYGCARNASQVHHRCTLNTLWVHQGCLMHASRMRLEYYLDVPWMFYGYPPMYHGCLIDTYSPWMYHGFSTHAMLTLKLGHCPWTILFVYLFIWLVRKLFFQNATSSTIMNGFFWYCIWIISRMSRIQLVLGVAIWRFLAHWRLITFSRKNGLLYSDTSNWLWRHNRCTEKATRYASATCACASWNTVVR